MKVLKYLLFGLAVLVVAVGVAIAYIAATFDPNPVSYTHLPSPRDTR